MSAEVNCESRNFSTSTNRGSVEAFLHEVFAARRAGGVCVGVSAHGERMFFRANDAASGGAGHISKETPLEAACLAKPLISLLAIALSKTGELTFDGPLGQYVPELRACVKGELLRIGHLLDHTAGYAGVADGLQVNDVAGRADLLSRIRDANQLFVPGSVFSYEQSGSLLLQEAVSAITGLPVAVLIRDHLLDQLDVEPKWYRGGVTTPAVDMLQLSVEDMLSICEAFIARRTEPGSRPNPVQEVFQSERSKGQTVSIPRPPALGGQDPLPVSHGYVLAGYSDGSLGHDGTGEGGTMGFRIRPSEGIAIVVGIAGRATLLRRKIMAGVLERMGGHIEPRSEKFRSSFGLDEIPGNYVGAQDLELEVSCRKSEVDVCVRIRGREVTRIHGQYRDNGQVQFRAPDASLEPVFFRDPAAGDLCLMLGVCAFKRSSGSSLPGRILVDEVQR